MGLQPRCPGVVVLTRVDDLKLSSLRRISSAAAEFDAGESSNLVLIALAAYGEGYQIQKLTITTHLKRLIFA